MSGEVKQSQEAKQVQLDINIQKRKIVRAYLKNRYENLKLTQAQLEKESKTYKKVEELSSFPKFCEHQYGILNLVESDEANLGSLDLSRLEEVILLEVSNENSESSYKVCIPVVKSKLASASDFFKGLFHNWFKESQGFCIKIKHQTPWVVEQLVYNLEAEFPPNRIKLKSYAPEMQEDSDYFLTGDMNLFFKSNVGNNKQKRRALKDEISEIKAIKNLSTGEKNKKIKELFYRYLQADADFLIKVLFEECGKKVLHDLDEDDGNNYLHKAILYKKLNYSVIKFLIHQMGGNALHKPNRNNHTAINLLQAVGVKDEVINNLKDIERLQKASEYPPRFG